MEEENQDPGNSQPDGNNNPTTTQNYDQLEWCPTNPDNGQTSQENPDGTTTPINTQNNPGNQQSGNVKDSGSSGVGGKNSLPMYITLVFTLLITFGAN